MYTMLNAMQISHWNAIFPVRLQRLILSSKYSFPLNRYTLIVFG